MFTFVQEMEHVDFATQSSSSRPRPASAELHVAAASARTGCDASNWSRQWVPRSSGTTSACLTSDDARPAPRLLAQRGLAGEIARQFKLGWAPDDWDAMSRDCRLPGGGVAGHRSGIHQQVEPMQDSFRARVMFPIMSENGDPVAFGGRILPGRRSGEVQEFGRDVIYAKSKTLYGLHGRRRHRHGRSGDRVRGLHRRDRLPPCGCATRRGHLWNGDAEEHVRLLKRFASRWCWPSMPTPRDKVPPRSSTSGSRSTRCRSAWPCSQGLKTPANSSLSNPARPTVPVDRQLLVSEIRVFECILSFSD